MSKKAILKAACTGKGGLWGSMVNTVKKIGGGIGNYLNENERLNKEASAEYTRRMGGPTAANAYHVGRIMDIKKELKKKKKAQMGI